MMVTRSFYVMWMLSQNGGLGIVHIGEGVSIALFVFSLGFQQVSKL